MLKIAVEGKIGFQTVVGEAPLEDLVTAGAGGVEYWSRWKGAGTPAGYGAGMR